MNIKTEREETEYPSHFSGKQFENTAPIVVFTLIGIVYLVTLLTLFPNLPITTRNAENIPTFMKIYPPFRMDEVNYYTMAQNIIDGEPYLEGSIEKSFSIGFSLVAVPFVAVWDKLGGYIANTVIVWFSLLVFFLTARRYVSCLKALLMTILLAFATLNWFYAVSCYTEPLSQLLILLGFYFLTWEKSSGKLNSALFAAGILSGLNLFVRPHYILIAIPFFLFYWIERNEKLTFNHRAFWFARGIVLIFVLWLVRNWIFFGNPLSFEYSRLVGRMAGYSYSINSVGYTGNFFWGMHQLLFDQFHGLLTITPILLVFPAGINRMWQNRMKKESLMLLSSVIIILVFVAFSPYPFTEFGLGSRHMLPILPLIFLPVIFFLDGTLFTRIIITILAVYSFYYSGLGWFTGEADYVGEQGFFIGLLHQRSSQAIILARKNLLPKRQFDSEEELIDTFQEARKKRDVWKLLQTLNPEVIKNISGNEQVFVNYLRTHSDTKFLILSVDREKGILLKTIVFK